MRGLLLGGLVAAVFWGGAIAVTPEAPGVEREEFVYYPSGPFLRAAAMGYDQAAAAVAWIDAVQYYGEHTRGDQKFDYLFHLCDVTTDLDPKFELPYTFGSLVLLTEGKRPSAAMRLLEKGRENNPRSWNLFFETGFSYYIAWEDYPKAAEYFTLAAGMPGAPEKTERFAAWVTYRAGELETSLVLWQNLAERTTSPELREKALQKVEELAAELAERKDASGS